MPELLCSVSAVSALLLPLPSPVRHLSVCERVSLVTPPVAVSSPPLMLMVVLLRALPPEPMPAPEAWQDPFSLPPPSAVIVPPSMLMMVLPLLPLPLPMPAAVEPPLAVTIVAP